ARQVRPPVGDLVGGHIQRHDGVAVGDLHVDGATHGVVAAVRAPVDVHQAPAGGGGGQAGPHALAIDGDRQLPGDDGERVAIDVVGGRRPGPVVGPTGVAHAVDDQAVGAGRQGGAVV